MVAFLFPNIILLLFLFLCCQNHVLHSLLNCLYICSIFTVI
uniref:Uncharacterized protein n=1 Tax=Anguilla anguilla TaxID=7936 RepID=A0A0E9V7W6_ANGAN